MKYETECAATFWSSQLNPGLGEATLYKFKKDLISLMCEKFALHWYDENPLQGQAYREITCDFDNYCVDSILIEASQHCGFSFYQHFGCQRGIRMWVDPGEVEVSFTSGPRNSKVLFSQGQSVYGSPVHSPRRSTSPVFYPPSQEINYYDSLSYTEPNLVYYDQNDSSNVFLPNEHHSYDDFNNCSVQSYVNTRPTYPVRHDVALM